MIVLARLSRPPRRGLPRGAPTRRPITPDAVARWPEILAQRLYTAGEVERFLAKVDARGPDDCWPWTSATVGRSATRPKGYGVLTRDSAGAPSVQVYAHRMSLELSTGEDIGRLLACHTCDRGLCANPAHLFPGTYADNSADMVTKGRQANQWK